MKKCIIVGYDVCGGCFMSRFRCTAQREHNYRRPINSGCAGVITCHHLLPHFCRLSSSERRRIVATNCTGDVSFFIFIVILIVIVIVFRFFSSCCCISGPGSGIMCFISAFTGSCFLYGV